MEHRDWRKSVVYQIYPKSFNDTTGSGEGDIRGIIEKLDYFKMLGVDYLWLTPVYESPMNDNGYDISDYYEVNPQFGDKKDLKELLEKAHAKDIRIMMDIVINHTSTEHQWFVDSRTSKDSKYRNYYIWKDSADGQPPTNWESKFGGNAWAYDSQTNQYYLRLFDITQADLNWENEDMRRDIYEMINYWIDFGVDGLRFDVINLISKGKFESSNGLGKEFYTDGPKVHEYINELNRNTFGDKDVMTVGEMSSTTIDHCLKYTDPERNELNSVFNFHHLKVDYPGGEKWTLANFDFLELKRILMEWQVAMDEGGGWNAIFWCNHDQPRVVSRFGNDQTEENRVLSGKMLAIALHGLKGTPYIYQGEEIGMTNPGFRRIDQYRDIESLNAYTILRERGMDSHQIMDILASKSRDNSRTPMQWDDSIHGGFTEGEPWIEVPKEYENINVGRALEDKASIFYTYQKLIQLRHELDVLTYGSVEPYMMEDENLFIYTRTYKNEKLTIIANFRDKEVSYPENISVDGEVLLSNYKDKKEMLRPYEALMTYGQEK
ncbi:alpha,alpha-phosphotrehalase [Salinicoccus sesuvii]|uniref:Alpha,alpha-phosphotrehalase n=1 Tax=Salinicoccus sesuvii TaxID=868281 RepID=A0ABV7N4Z9_9STAP